MVTADAFRELALSFDGAHEEPHFDRASFRVKKRIFATLAPDGREAMVKVKPPEAALALIEERPDVFFGYGGWTTGGGAVGVRLAKVGARVLRELLTESWRHAAGPGAPGRASATGSTGSGSLSRKPGRRRRVP